TSLFLDVRLVVEDSRHGFDRDAGRLGDVVDGFPAHMCLFSAQRGAEFSARIVDPRTYRAQASTSALPVSRRTLVTLKPSFPAVPNTNGALTFFMFAPALWKQLRRTFRFRHSPRGPLLSACAMGTLPLHPIPHSTERSTSAVGACVTRYSNASDSSPLVSRCR